MSGIIFLKTRSLDTVLEFYVDLVGMEVWLTQADCIILKHGNLLLGFCEKLEGDIDFGGIITFFYDTWEEVYDMHRKFSEEAEGEPKVNPKYKIYHFFARDPEGRLVEFQQFQEPVEEVGG